MNIGNLIPHYVKIIGKYFGYQQADDSSNKPNILNSPSTEAIKGVVEARLKALDNKQVAVDMKRIKIRTPQPYFEIFKDWKVENKALDSLKTIKILRGSIIKWFGSLKVDLAIFKQTTSGLNDVVILNQTDPVLKQVKWINGKKYIHRITREACVQCYIRMVDAQIERLEKRIKQRVSDKNSLERVEMDLVEQIHYYKIKKQIAAAYLRNAKQDWLRPDYFRNLIKSHFSNAEVSLIHETPSPEQHFRNAMHDYLPTLVNCRYQELIIDGEKKIGFYRLGVISDMRNGWVSLKELKAMKKDRYQLETKITLLSNNLEQLELEKLSIGNKLSKLRNLNASPLEESEKKTENTQVFERKIASLKYALEELRGAWRSEKLLDHAISERRQVLHDKMLLLVAKQVEAKIGSLPLDSTEFKMFHLGLLNTRSDKLDKTGWKHDERVELEDMHEIFQEFNGKEIHFDADEPYLDEKGIHLKKNNTLITQFSSSLRLKAGVVNVSVQGSTNNTGVANDLNEETLRLHPRLFVKHPEIENELLYCKKFNYKFAQSVALALLDDPSIALSMGCFGAKDRTGLTAELTIADLVGQYSGCTTEKNPFYKEILQESSLAHQVLEECVVGQKKNGKKAQTALKIWLGEPLPAVSLAQKVRYLKKQIKDLFS